MHNRPTPNFDPPLPFSLAVEFLIAVGAGRDDARLGLKRWKISEIAAHNTIKVTPQSLYSFFKGETNAENFGPSLFKLLTEGQYSDHQQQLHRAFELWASWDDDQRKDAINEALDKHGLPPTIQERQGFFIKLSHQLQDQQETQQVTVSKPSISQRLGMIGFLDLVDASNQLSGFHAFLNEESLRYFSRDDYMEETGNTAIDVSEKNLVLSIDEKSTNQTFLISGPGGFGKTRLAHQICRLSDANLAVRVDTNAADYLQLFDILATTATPPKHLIFFIDYAENTSNTSPLYAFCEQAHTGWGMKATILLCSRTNGVARVRDTFLDPAMNHYPIGSQSAGSNVIGYEDWLVQSILGYFDLAHKEGLVETCHSTPFLAAFSGFLSKKHPQAFESQFGAIGTDPSFRQWVRSRTKAFERLGHRGKRRLSEMVLALPFYDADDQFNIADDVDGTGAAVLQILEEDRWIEQDVGGNINMIHDSLADAIIADQVFNAPRPTNRLGELLSTATEKEYLGRALNVIQRGASREDLRGIDSVELVMKLAKKQPVAVQHNALDILRSGIVASETIPDLLEATDDIYQGLDNDRQAYRFLTQIAARLKQESDFSTNSGSHPKFASLLHKASLKPDARTLANLVHFCPEAHLDAAESFIKRKRNEYDTAYVISAYLEYIDDPSAAGPLVVEWLAKHGMSRRSGYIFAAWFSAVKRLKERGATKVPAFAISNSIQGTLKKWCGRHRTDHYAAKCLQILIECEKANDDTKRLVEAWLGENGSIYMATHLVSKWIAVRNAVEQDSMRWVRQWLLSNAARNAKTECGYLFKALRDYDAPLNEYADLLLLHISMDGPIRVRRDLCRYWLELGGDPESIREVLYSLIVEQPSDPRVRFCFESWVKYCPSDASFFEKEMCIWLSANAEHSRASHIFSIWDDLDLDPSLIAQPLSRWIATNRESNFYHTHLAKYITLDPEGAAKLGPSEDQARYILSKKTFHHQECRDIEFMLQAPYGSDASSQIAQDIIAAASRYLKQYGKNPLSAFLISLVLRKVGNVPWIRSYADVWLSKHQHRHRANLVLQALLKVDPEPVELAQLVKNWFAENPTYHFGGNLLMAWVETCGKPEVLKPQARVWLAGLRGSDKFPDFDSVEEAYF